MSKTARKYFLITLAALAFIWLIVTYVRMSLPAKIGTKLDCRNIKDSVIEIVRPKYDGGNDAGLRLTDEASRKWFLERLADIEVRMVGNQTTEYSYQWSITKVVRDKFEYTIVISGDRVLFLGVYYQTRQPDALIDLLEQTWERYPGLIEKIDIPEQTKK